VVTGKDTPAGSNNRTQGHPPRSSGPQPGLIGKVAQRKKELSWFQLGVCKYHDSSDLFWILCAFHLSAGQCRGARLP